MSSSQLTKVGPIKMSVLYDLRACKKCDAVIIKWNDFTIKVLLMQFGQNSQIAFMLTSGRIDCIVRFRLLWAGSIIVASWTTLILVYDFANNCKVFEHLNLMHCWPMTLYECIKVCMFVCGT